MVSTYASKYSCMKLVLAFSMSQRTPYSLTVPHALTLIKENDQVCVADREHGRILCYDTSSGSFSWEFKDVDVTGTRLFSVAYSQGKLFIVNGPEFDNRGQVSGFVIDVPYRRVAAAFQPGHGTFHSPHDIAVSGGSIYVVELNPSRIYKFLISNSTADGAVTAKQEITAAEGKGILKKE